MTEATTSAADVRDFDGVTIPTPGTFDLDPAHTRIGFSARHMMVSKVRGRFGEFTGSLTVADDPFSPPRRRSSRPRASTPAMRTGMAT